MESAYYNLFKFFYDEHGLILLDSDIQEIIDEVARFHGESPETEISYPFAASLEHAKQI